MSTPYSYVEGVLREGDVPLAYKLSLPRAPRAALALVHGYGEHSARYAHVIQHFAARDIGVVTFDQRGHGLSGGVRGHCDRFSEYHRDLALVLGLARKNFDGVPLFGFGHSFGGLVVSTYALEHPQAFRGLVLSSPYFGLALAVPPAKIWVGKIASRLLPTLAVPAGLSGKDLTHDADLARAYDNDPLGNKGATARWFTESSSAQASLLARAGELTLPVYLAHGAEDKVASPAASRAVFDHLGSKDRRYEGKAHLFHEILNEPSWASIADEMADWVLARA
ncbi:MAG: lysophospholipase [Myxococcales bacterium]|nr:lysophospholipase [Myxococcales bacterium]